MFFTTFWFGKINHKGTKAQRRQRGVIFHHFVVTERMKRKEET
jgi:hypothetical protein